MIVEFRRLLTRMLSMPLTTFHDRFHRFRTGRGALLTVTIEPKPTTAERQATLVALQRACRDPDIRGVLFRVSGAPGGRAAIHDLRTQIGALRAADKVTIAFLEHADNGAMWVAAAAEHVFVVPTGEIGLVGLGGELQFFGKTLERLGVQPEVLAAGAYKAAGEMFARSFASPANLEATEELLADLADQMLADIGEDRGLTRAQLDAILAIAPVGAEEAVGLGLVDRLFYEDQLESWLEETFGEDLPQVDLMEWAARAGRQEQIERLGRDDKKIAVLHLDGPIVMEDSRGRVAIRAKTVVPMLDALREDDDVGAVVLHVSSPGGGVLPSDLIWRAVDRLRAEKPVVASYEDVSASGGVYITSPATEVLARPGTVTGSVGVVMMKMAVGEGLRRLGVVTQPVQTAPNANLYSGASRFTSAQRARVEEQLDRWYDGFVSRVAEGRKQPKDVLEPHCRGRIWTGRSAVEKGLVDGIGTLSDAIERARILAGLPVSAPRQDMLGNPVNPWMKLLREQLGGLPLPVGSLAGRVLEKTVGAVVLERVDLLLEHEGQALALLPFEIR